MSIYQEALDSQSACNLSGLVRSLARMTDAIWDEARAENKGTDYVNRHPVVILMLAQMVWLATGETIDSIAYHRAYNVCLAKTDIVGPAISSRRFGNEPYEHESE